MPLSLPALAVVCVVAIAITWPPAFGAEDDSQPVDVDLALTDLAGDSVAPLRCTGEGKAAVLIFITTDCPIANAYAPEINRLHEAFAKAGVRLTLVHVDHDLDVADARQHAEDYALEASIVIDREHALVAALEASVTPQAFVIDRDGQVRYRGRINNLYADYGERRAQVSEHDLRDAVEAVLAGREVTTPETEALGCFIESR